jgi:Lrp/AsnC family transcriptional regulator for asnA, asnC and gidA
MNSLDRIDWKIISLLNEDGRMSSAEIARRIGDIPARTVNHRIAKLTEHGIISVRAILNPPTLGYDVMADVFIRVEPGRVRQVAERVAEFTQVSYVACATGSMDISISVRVRSNEELFNFVADEISNIPGVRGTETYLLSLKFKDLDTWLPEEATAVVVDDEHSP